MGLSISPKHLRSGAAASALVVLTLPLMTFVALAIKCESRGPVFERRQRIVPGGRRTFDLLTSRTTTYDPADTMPSWARRPTPLGSFLQYTRIEALPQLINAARGEVSCLKHMAGRVRSGTKWLKRVPEIKRMVRMPDQVDLTTILNQDAFRRLWLLRKAMETAPMDRAIALARMAEEFIAGSATQPAPVRPTVEEAPQTAHPPMEAAITTPSIQPLSSEPRPSLVLSAEQRGQLLERLAKGARNAELAAEFGLSPRQVQGVRMGSAREIAERRRTVLNGTPLRSDHSQEKAAPNGTPLRSDHSGEQAVPNGTPPRSDRSHEQAIPDDIVRYLRQQDDIVVPEGTGAFLVNGRFRLELPELVSRANKMRGRQGKPEFRLTSELPNQNRARAATRHPMFWERESGSDPVTRAN